MWRTPASSPVTCGSGDWRGRRCTFVWPMPFGGGSGCVTGSASTCSISTSTSSSPGPSKRPATSSASTRRATRRCRPGQQGPSIWRACPGFSRTTQHRSTRERQDDEVRTRDQGSVRRPGGSDEASGGVGRGPGDDRRDGLHRYPPARRPRRTRLLHDPRRVRRGGRRPHPCRGGRAEQPAPGDRALGREAALDRRRRAGVGPLRRAVPHRHHRKSPHRLNDAERGASDRLNTHRGHRDSTDSRSPPRVKFRKGAPGCPCARCGATPRPRTWPASVLPRRGRCPRAADSGGARRRDRGWRPARPPRRGSRPGRRLPGGCSPWPRSGRTDRWPDPGPSGSTARRSRSDGGCAARASARSRPCRPWSPTRRSAPEVPTPPDRACPTQHRRVDRPPMASACREGRSRRRSPPPVRCSGELLPRPGRSASDPGTVGA